MPLVAIRSYVVKRWIIAWLFLGIVLLLGNCGPDSRSDYSASNTPSGAYSFTGEDWRLHYHYEAQSLFGVLDEWCYEGQSWWLSFVFKSDSHIGKPLIDYGSYQMIKEIEDTIDVVESVSSEIQPITLASGESALWIGIQNIFENHRYVLAYRSDRYGMWVYTEAYDGNDMNIDMVSRLYQSIRLSQENDISIGRTFVNEYCED